MTRVEIPAYMDAWMRGARFGTIVKIVKARGPLPKKGTDIAHVRMDHPGIKKLVRVILDDCRVL